MKTFRSQALFEILDKEMRGNFQERKDSKFCQKVYLLANVQAEEVVSAAKSRAAGCCEENQN